MTNRVLWLLSYIGLSLALALGNRQTAGAPQLSVQSQSQLQPQQQQQQQQQQQRTSSNKERLQLALIESGVGARAEAARQHALATRNALHDWLLYDKRAAPDAMLAAAAATSSSSDRLLLLDDVLSALLGNFYRQQQQQRHHAILYNNNNNHHHNSPPRLDDEDDEDQEEEEEDDEEDEQLPRRTQQRSRIASYYEHKSPAAKRNYKQQPQRHQETSPVALAQAAGASMASQFLLRSARGNRQYDVPQIECPLSDDGMERFACPTPDELGRYRCIDDHVLCDGFTDCPAGDDEDRQACMFYKTTKAHLDVLADALLRWARGR